MPDVSFKDLQQGKVIYVMKRMDIGRCSYHDIRENDSFPWNLAASDEDVYKMVSSDKDLQLFSGCGKCEVGCPVKDEGNRMNYDKIPHVHHIRVKDMNCGSGILVVVKYVLKDGLSCERPKRVEKALNH